MRYVINVEEMRALEQNAIRGIGIPEEVLMERAAFAVWQELEKRTTREDPILFLCGTGNNGGDGLAAARMAYLGGRNVSVAIVSKDKVRVFALKDFTEGGKIRPETVKKEELTSHCSAGFAGQLTILSKICDFVGKDRDFGEYTIVVDAVFGIGLSRPITGTYRECIQKIQQEKRRRKLGVISVDIPSGIHADTGAVMGIALEADLTVTFGWEKIGLLLYPGAQYAGEIVTADIGIPPEPACLTENTVLRMEPADIRLLSGRKPDTHKGDYGKVAVIAGSKGMCGAAILAGKAACRAGAGITAVVSAEENRIPIQTALPEAIFTPRSRAEERIAWADCLAVGPGLGTDAEAEGLVRLALASGKPVVADADALNCISRAADLYGMLHDQVILTPHVGEMARLSGFSVAEIRENPVEIADGFAEQYGCICVLKGARTFISGGKAFRRIHTGGNAGMAAGGSGDVLTGIIAGLLGTERDAKTAAAFGVLVHGLAGDQAKEKFGERSMTAADMLDGIPAVFS